MAAVLQEKRKVDRVNFRASDVPVGDVADREKELVLIPFQEAMRHYCGPDLEAISATSPFLLDYVDSQPLLAAIHIAFCFHLPLVLTPDAVWATLAKGVCLHINQNSEQLRSVFVDFDGKEMITIRRDDLRRGDPNLPWPEVIDEFTDQLGLRAPEANSLFNAHFSTTGLAEQTAFRVAMLDSMQKFFTYKLETLCGIPEVTLEGSPEDWEEIANRIARFRDLGLDAWVDALEPVAAEFVSASQGNADSSFWDNIYKYHPPSGSGTFYTTGWIRDLFPYLMPDEWEGSNEYRVNEFIGKSSSEGPTIGEFPSKPARAPFNWEYLGESIDMELIAGLVGVSYCPDTLEVKPEFGWAVREATPFEPVATRQLGNW